METHAAWQHAQQALRAKKSEQARSTAAEPNDSTNSGTMQRSLSQESGSGFRRGEMPVFRLPGVQIRLPTAVGIVSFSPLFLSKEQLTRTWVSAPFHAPFSSARNPALLMLVCAMQWQKLCYQNLLLAPLSEVFHV